MYFVYMHKNKINNKVYIGITSRIPQQRWGTDGRNYKSSPHFYAAIQKYGWDNFEHIILFEKLTKEEACSKEQELIAKYKAMDRNFGYNETSGGDMPTMSNTSRAKLSLSMMGNQNGFGHVCSQEKREKISKAQKGRIFSDEHRKKLSEAAKQRHTPCSEDKKKKLSQRYPNKKKVICIELDIIYDSIHECSRQLDIPATNITAVCKGRHKTAGGYHFQYL